MGEECSCRRPTHPNMGVSKNNVSVVAYTRPSKSSRKVFVVSSRRVFAALLSVRYCFVYTATTPSAVTGVARSSACRAPDGAFARGVAGMELR